MRIKSESDNDTRSLMKVVLNTTKYNTKGIIEKSFTLVRALIFFKGYTIGFTLNGIYPPIETLLNGTCVWAVPIAVIIT